jgi:hypothetical protein
MNPMPENHPIQPLAPMNNDPSGKSRRISLKGRYPPSMNTPHMIVGFESADGVGVKPVIDGKNCVIWVTGDPK